MQYLDTWYSMMFQPEIFNSKISSLLEERVLIHLHHVDHGLQQLMKFQDAQNLKLTTKINGELRQNSSTSKMFIKIPEIVSKISKVMTLEKGDIISTGTPAGVALNNPNIEFLKDGDKVEMEIEGLGILNNTIKFVKSD